MNHSSGLRRLLAVDGRDIANHEETVFITRIANRSFNNITSTERVTADLLLRDENIFRAGEEVVLRGTEEAVSLTDDLQTAACKHRTTLLQIHADRGENELVLTIRAELLRIGTGHHAFDDDGS